MCKYELSELLGTIPDTGLGTKVEQLVEQKIQAVERATLGGMNTAPHPAAVRFLIKIISPEPQPFEQEIFEIRSQLNNGHWTQLYVAQGIHDLRSTLIGRGADEVRVGRAINELRRSREAEIDMR